MKVIRTDSKSYGKLHGELFTEENKTQFLIQRGFGYDALVLSEIAEFCYEYDDFYHPNGEGKMT